MKNLKIALIACLTFLCFHQMKAQKNVVKLGLGSATNLNLNVKYERAVSDKASFQIAFLYDVPSNKGRLQVYNIDSKTYNLTKTGYYLIPEFRYYFGKKDAPAGFYLGLYGKLGKTSLGIANVPVTNNNIPTDFNIDVNHFAIGPHMGVQWIINEKFSIDWNIGGIGYSLFRVGWGFESESDLVYSKEKLIEEFEDIVFELPFPENFRNFILTKGSKTITDINGKSYQSPKFPVSLLDLRFGLSIGYAF